MIDISNHAKEEMAADDITEEEVRQCLDNGELDIKQIVDGEMRYGKQLATKDKKIMVIYTLKKDVVRVITAYIIQRKRQW